MDYLLLFRFKSFTGDLSTSITLGLLQDPFQDSWNKGGSFESSRPSSRVPSGPTENLRKASSATNIVDDLSSIFGGSAISEVHDVTIIFCRYALYFHVFLPWSHTETS